jgi:EmrB/QacA subfamily drug resistance transporter
MSIPLDRLTSVGATPPKSDFRTIALIIASAMFMEQLDATVLATALPTMARDFGVSAPHMSIALTSYLLSLAIFIPASGKVADRFGARLVFRIAIGVFMLGSILCAQSTSLGFLVFARLLQGLGGAMMMPVGRLVLLRSVHKSDMVAAMSWLLVPALLGPILGPPVGGAIVSYLNWRWIFYINVPIGLLGIVLVSIFIEDVREEKVGRFDTFGLLLSGLSLGCLLFGFETAGREMSAAGTVLLLAIGGISWLLYMRHARRTPEPILDLSLMRIQTFRLSVIAGSLTRITQGAQPFLLPLMLQLGFGLSAVQSGLVTFATAGGSMAMKAAAPGILRRFGFRTTLIGNGILSTLGYAACAAFRPAWPIWSISLVLLVSGFFMSLQFTAYNTLAYDEIPRSRMSAATSFYTTFQQLTLSFGICTAALSMHASMLIHLRAHPAFGDFSAAFLVVTFISLFSVVSSARLPLRAGAEISGHPAGKPAAT